MQATDNQVAEWEHAYRVLGVPASASPRAIKTAWHRLVRQWSPDHCPGGTDEQAEAARMTAILNTAYHSIEAAPLWQYAGIRDVDSRQGSASATIASGEAMPAFHWYSFWLRFACGALFGALVSFRMVIYAYENPLIMIPGVAATILFFAFTSGFAGEKLLNSMRGH